MQEKVYSLNPSHRRKLPRILKGSKKTAVLGFSSPKKSPSKSQIQLSAQQMPSKWRRANGVAEYGVCGFGFRTVQRNGFSASDRRRPAVSDRGIFAGVDARTPR